MPETYTFQEVKTEKEYNPLEICSSAPFVQGFFYGEWQKNMGRKVRRFKATRQDQTLAYFQITKYPLPLGQSYLYIAHGPITRETLTEKFLASFRKEILKILYEEKASFARFDFYPLIKNPIQHQGFKKTPDYSYHSSALQAKYEWILNIAKPTDELLAEMHPKTRYRIRLAEKRGVMSEIVRGQEMQPYFEKFYTLMRDTAERGHFGLHPQKYYRTIFADAAHNPNIDLVITRYNKEILTTYIIIRYGDTAFYPLGASSRTHKDLMPTYFAHWRAILECQRLGCKWYNFGALNVGGKIHNSGWEGITEFKTRFRGEVLEYSDFYDIVAKPFWYYIYNLRRKLKS